MNSEGTLGNAKKDSTLLNGSPDIAKSESSPASGKSQATANHTDIMNRTASTHSLTQFNEIGGASDRNLSLPGSVVDTKK